MAAKKTEEKKLSIEEAFSELEDKITALEDENTTLEDSFKEYQEGMKLVKYCHDLVSDVEQKVMKIAEDGSLEDFE